MLNNKKAISPLVATFLLIFFAVILGIIVISWGRAQLEEASVCAVKTNLKVVEINNKSQICYDPEGYIFFILENGPNIDILELQLRVITDERKIFLTDIPSSAIKKNYAISKNISYEYDKYGEPIQIKITPKVKIYEDEFFCPEQALIIENPKKCKEIFK